MGQTAEQVAGTQLQSGIRRGYFWTFCASTLRYVGGFGISVILARLLQPSDYGLVGMVLVFFSFLSAFQDMGLGVALVHFNEERNALPTYFTATALLGVILTLGILTGAPLIAAFYHEPRLTVLLRVLSITLFLTSICNILQAVLTKHFRFKQIAFAEAGSSLAAGIIAIFFAWRGMGVWSLVINLILFGVFQAAILSFFVRPEFTLFPRRDVTLRLVHYGLPLTASNLLNQFYDNADFLVVGSLAGSAALGYYSQAFRLATLAHERIGVLVNRVAFPSFAALQKQPEKVVEQWLAVSRAVSLINVPILSFLLVNAHDLIVLVYGEKWLPGVLPLRYLCLVGVLRSLVSITLHVMNAMGQTKARLQFSLVNAVLLPVSFVTGCYLRGIEGVGIAWCIVYPGIWAFAILSVRRFLDFSILAYFRNLRLPLLTAAVCILSMYFTAGPSGVLPRLFVRGLVWTVAASACLLMARDIRGWAVRLTRKYVLRKYSPQPAI